MKPRKYDPSEPTPYTPPDAAEYLEGDMPRYQGDARITLDDGTVVDLNKLQNLFDPDANEGHTK